MSTPDLATPAIGETPAAAPKPAAVRTSRFSTPGEGSSTLISAITVVVLLALWWLASHLRWVPPLFLPTPEVVFERLYESAAGQLTDAPLAEHFGWSMFRVFTAFIAACVTAIPIGVAMGVSRVMRGIFDPPIEFYRPLPPLAYLPLIVIWFGIDELSKILLIYLACFRSTRRTRWERRKGR